jgi:hypothetical protein
MSNTIKLKSNRGYRPALVTQVDLDQASFELTGPEGQIGRLDETRTSGLIAVSFLEDVTINSFDAPLNSLAIAFERLLANFTEEYQVSLERIKLTNSQIRDDLNVRFDILPARVMENNAVRNEIDILRKYIWLEIDKKFPPK